MWGLALYRKVCDDHRSGKGPHPKVVFAQMAAEVLVRSRERLSRWKRCDDCGRFDECVEWLDGEKVEARLCKGCDEGRERDFFSPPAAAGGISASSN